MDELLGFVQQDSSLRQVNSPLAGYRLVPGGVQAHLPVDAARAGQRGGGLPGIFKRMSFSRGQSTNRAISSC